MRIVQTQRDMMYPYEYVYKVSHLFLQGSDGLVGVRFGKICIFEIVIDLIQYRLTLLAKHVSITKRRVNEG